MAENSPMQCVDSVKIKYFVLKQNNLIKIVKIYLTLSAFSFILGCIRAITFLPSLVAKIGWEWKNLADIWWGMAEIKKFVVVLE
jgi:hypothetical protein